MFRSKKQKADLLENHHRVKRETFYFSQIRQYFSGSDKTNTYQVISDRTYNDLDLDELFMFIDRTVSRVGQQYYYAIFRTISNDEKWKNRLDYLIRLFKENPSLKESVLEQLARLKNPEAYYITSLIYDLYVQKPNWFWVVRLLSAISIASILLSFFFPQLLIFLLFVLIINYFIHYWNKRNLFQHSGSILQLLLLHQVAKRLLMAPEFSDEKKELRESFNALDRISNQMAFFKPEATFQSEIGLAFEFIAEVLKALLLIEPQLLFKALAALNSKREQIRQIYQFVAELDVAISVASLRDGLAYCTSPTIVSAKKQLSATEMYHPLLENWVSNSIKLCERSALLTGSNMSGKTTFICTMGINAILGQTINTCFAREFTMPRLRVHSAIRIADDLMSEKSYYFEEVRVIKEMLDESRSGAQNLFLLDELFKGTNTVERIAAGKSVLIYLNSNNNFVLVATHDLELTEYLSETYQLYHFTEVIKDKAILFDYKIKGGNLETTNAIRILELNHYPPEIIANAKELSEQFISIKAAKLGL